MSDPTAPRLRIDVETRSRVDLRKCGVYRYSRCPDFRILMAGWSLDGSPVKVATDLEEMREIPGLFDPDVVKVAHNAQFERVCFSIFTEGKRNFLPPGEWHDTQAVAAELGYPQSLDMLAKTLGATKKDTAGTRLINLFSKPNRKGEFNDSESHPSEWLEFLLYNVQDVETLAEVDDLLGWEWPYPMEWLVFLADQAINDRGIRIDRQMARKAVEASAENQAWQIERVRELGKDAYGNPIIENPNSQQQMMKWVRYHSLDADNLQAATVSRLLEGDLTASQREVLELRQELALLASKKFQTALESAVGDRLHGSFKFFGAHTGRWAGRGTQLQNLPRHSFEDEDHAEAAIVDLKAGFGATSDNLKRLVRPMFTGPFTVVDYSAIEARVVAWLAGEEWALEAFRQGRDIYVETAERMGGLTRAQGKIAVLALGYNGGPNSLKAMAGDHDSFTVGAGRRKEERLIKTMPDKELARHLVQPWRRANPAIVRLWSLLGDAFGDPMDAGPILKTTESYDKLGRAVHLWLPSGRAITYRGTKFERFRSLDPVTGRPKVKEAWRFADPKNPFNPKQRIQTYGGRLTENATQAVARDIMAEALVRLEERGYRVVGHIHDEILVEGIHDVEEIAAIMTEPPKWAKGLPIDGEGFVTHRYRKG